MGQYWQFFNLSKLHHAEPNGSQKLASIFFPKQSFLVRSLTIPYPVPELAKYLADAPDAGPIAEKGLLSLPDELLCELIEHEDLPWKETVCLAATCKKLLAIAEGRMLKNSRNYSSAIWADCRVVCLGDYTYLHRVPESLIRPALRTQIIDAHGKDLEARNKWREEHGEETIEESAEEEAKASVYAGLFRICGDAMQRGVLFKGVHTYTLEDFLLSLPLSDRRLFVAATAVTFPERDDWVLCNTVKYEYVRAGALAALSGCPNDEQPFLQDSTIDLGTALFTRFCFTSSEDNSFENNAVNILQGKWVGDRFAIDTIERVIKNDTEHEWTDVTDEVVADIQAVYRAEYPETWEKEMRRRHGPWDSSWFYADNDYNLSYLLDPELERRRQLWKRGIYDSDSEEARAADIKL